MSQKMIQPNSDVPCIHCGASEHNQPIRCEAGKVCPHCGGVHWGSAFCPYSETQAKAEVETKVVEMPEAPWHPAMKQIIEWRNANRPEDPGEDQSLTRLLFQLDGRLRHLDSLAKGDASLSGLKENV